VIPLFGTWCGLTAEALRAKSQEFLIHKHFDLRELCVSAVGLNLKETVDPNIRYAER
jgi:hypothetical protein